METAINNNRYYNLRNRLLKTLRSMKYMLTKKNYKMDEMESYSKRICSGIMNLFRADTREFVSIITEPRVIRVTVKGQYVADMEIVPSEIIGTITYREIAPEQLADTITNYVQVYIHDILSGDLRIDPVEYVDIILENYLNLTRNIGNSSGKKPYCGKLQLY